MVVEKDLTEYVSCYVCAWRETCKIRYGKPPSYAKRCPEFTWDVTIKKRIIAELEKEEKGGKKQDA